MQYDSDTQTVFTEVDPPGSTPQLAVGILELGKSVNAVIYHECVGTTQIKIMPWVKFPFAVLSKTPNSRSCGYVAPGGFDCQFTVLPPILEHETIQGERDGTATLQVFLIGRALEYSLDNRHWQTSKTFSNLGPGNYKWYVRAGECKKSGTFTINVGAPSDTFIFPWTQKYCQYFRLVRNGVQTDIAEPAKWDSVNIKGKRDPEWHGWKDQYSDEVIELEFDCPAGKEILQAEYNENGSDGTVGFQYGIRTQNGSEYSLFDGKINFNTYKRYPNKVAASVESVKYNPMIKTRIDTKVSMTDKKSIDGMDIAAPPVREFRLHSKELARQFICVNNSWSETMESFQTTKKVFIIPNTSEASATEIEDTYTYGLEQIPDAPYDIDLYNHLVKYEGEYNFHIEYSIALKIRAFGSTGSFVARSYIMFNDEKIQIGGGVTGDMDSGLQVFNINVNGDFTRQLKPNDEVYFFTEVNLNIALGAYLLTVTQNSINVTVAALERAEASNCKGWFLFDAINHVVKSITNDQTYLKSSFLSKSSAQQPVDGPGSLYITTNGKQIRRFDVANNPLVISAKDLLESVRALFCLGYGFETVAGIDVMRIERVNYFYQNKEMMVIEECWDYVDDEVAKELLYNEFEVGYEIFQDEGNNTLDEFNTKSEGTTAIKTNKLKLVAKSKAITSGYSLESSRRMQFDATPTNSYQNDDNSFIIAMRRNGSDYATERSEAFDTVTGVISPDTAYNLRLSPKRMLLNWAVWLKNIFHYKKDTEVIKPTLVVQNGELTTRFKPTEPNPIGDINKELIKENEEVSLANYAVEERIFRPEWISFKTKITPDKIQLINRAMKGSAHDSVNYGYIAVKDKDGLYQAGYLYELDYNFHTEQATMKLLKKHDSPVTPGEVCCDYLAVNGCRLLVNGNKIII